MKLPTGPMPVTGRPFKQPLFWRVRGRLAFILVNIAIRLDFAIVAFMSEAIAIALHNYSETLIERPERKPEKPWQSHLN